MKAGSTRSAARGRSVHGGCVAPQGEAVVQPVDRITVWGSNKSYKMARIPPDVQQGTWIIVSYLSTT